MTLTANIHLIERSLDIGTVFSDEAHRAYAFARNHTWGRLAQLRHDNEGNEYLARLIDAYTLNGLYHEELVAIPATVKDAREFGGY